MTERDSKYLRGQLASVGILLDDPTEQQGQSFEVKQTPAIQVDRAEVRRILIARGAPARSLHWLCRSCPSIEAAHTYTPPDEP